MGLACRQVGLGELASRVIGHFRRERPPPGPGYAYLAGVPHGAQGGGPLFAGIVAVLLQSPERDLVPGTRPIAARPRYTTSATSATVAGRTRQQSTTVRR